MVADMTTSFEQIVSQYTESERNLKSLIQTFENDNKQLEQDLNELETQRQRLIKQKTTAARWHKSFKC